MLPTLAEQHPDVYERLKVTAPSIAKMMARFHRPKEIDDALDVKACASHWVTGRNGVSGMTERLAAEWVAKQDGPAPSDGVFMVVCPADKTAKVSKVLGLMGCEVVEI